MRFEKYGVSFEHDVDLISLHRDEKLGWWFRIKAKRQEIDVRVTKTGLLRVSRPRKSDHRISAKTG